MTARVARVPCLRLALALCLTAALSACASAPKPKPKPKPVDMSQYVSVLEYNTKTQQLLDATDSLVTLEGNVDELKRRLAAICVEYPDHRVCAAHAAADFAREAFCSDEEFVGHIDEIVSACHQGQCKQVDQAELITRSQYMLLIQRLPHTLVTFRAADTKLDRRDQAQLQTFLENIDADGGYIIVVGRASKDGSWRKNLQYALDRAESTRQFVTSSLGFPSDRVGYITYGHDKMYLTALDAQRLSDRKMSEKQANRSALIFAYPCHDAR